MSLSFLSSLSSLNSSESCRNSLDSSAGSTNFTFQISKPCACFLFHICVKSFARVTFNIFFHILFSQSQEMFCLITTNQYHLIIRTHCTITTQFRQEIFKHVTMFTTNCNDLFVEIQPC